MLLRRVNEDQKNGLAGRKDGKCLVDIQHGRCKMSGSQVCSGLHRQGTCVGGDHVSQRRENVRQRCTFL